MREEESNQEQAGEGSKQQEKASLLHSAAELLIISITGCAPGKPSGEPPK